ncbi:MAG TPA: ATP-binding protein [Nitrososphaeraceae archaeon]|nr:ATP-binding protein [Nitrososphaeraceae archaeon]
MTHSYSHPPPASAVHEKTDILYGTENVLGSLIEFLSKAKRIDSCGDSKSPSLAIEVDMYRKLLVDAKNKGIKVRQVTDITKENIHYCKELLKLGYEIRHLDEIKANFSVSETEYIATAAALREAQPVPQIIYSNVKDIVEQQRYVFESLWNRAKPAETRIKEIEEGVELEKTHVIEDPQGIQKLFVDMVKSAQHEVLLILPTVNAFLREHRIGIIQLLMQVARDRGVSVRILTPTNDVINNVLENTVVSYQEDGVKKRDFDLRSINISSEETAVSTVTIIVVDKKESLVFEKTDDKKENFVEAVGFATYSNSKPTVMSYISIFKNLWNQVDLYEQLKNHDKMQKEFINIASHEMKTPTQAIIGYADLIQKHPEKRDDMMQALSRNAVRLQRLTNDILDVTRIDSNTLNLHKEQFNLDNLIANVVQDYVGYIENENPNLKLFYNFKQEIDDHLPIDADRDRITQVISNLLNNAIKFTSKKTEGIISVSAERKNNSQEEVIVIIKDTGEGINPEILPRLFTKFATRSFSGTGLGLYISKSIVEAHEGKMWAENNPEGEGATFTFTLPLSSRKDKDRL